MQVAHHQGGDHPFQGAGHDEMGESHGRYGEGEGVGAVERNAGGVGEEQGLQTEFDAGGEGGEIDTDEAAAGGADPAPRRGDRAGAGDQAVDAVGAEDSLIGSFM